MYFPEGFDAGQSLRAFAATQRARPGARGTSRDGLAEVVLDGLGDVVQVSARVPSLDARTTAKLNTAILAAWRAAAGRRSRDALSESPYLAEIPGLVDALNDEFGQRFAEPAPPRPEEPDDYAELSYLREPRKRR